MEEWGSPKLTKGQVDLEQKEEKELQGWGEAQRCERNTEKWRAWRSQELEAGGSATWSWEGRKPRLYLDICGQPEVLGEEQRERGQSGPVP